MSEQPDESNSVDDDRVRLERLARNSKTRRERLDAAKASVDRLLTGVGQKISGAGSDIDQVLDADSDPGERPMFEAEPAKPPVSAVTPAEGAGVQVPAFRSANAMPAATGVPRRKRKRGLKNLWRRKRKKVFF